MAGVRTKPFEDNDHFEDLTISAIGVHLGSLDCLDLLTPPEVTPDILEPADKDIGAVLDD